MKKSGLAIIMLVILLSGCLPQTSHEIVTGDDTNIPAESLPSTESSSMEPLSTDNFDRLEQVARFGNGFIQDVAVSPDQSIMAVYVGENIHLYDTETLNIKQSIDAGKYVNTSFYIHFDDWNILSFTSDNETLVFSDGRKIILWDISENNRLTSFYSLVPEWDVVNITLSPKEDKVMITTLGGSVRCDGSDMNFALYDLNGKLIFDRYTCASHSINSFHFTSDEKVLFKFASIMTSIYPTQTILLDAVSGKILEQTHAEYLDYEQPLPDLELLYDISPDGELLAYAIYNQVDEVINVRTRITLTETKEVIHEQDGLVEFFLDQGEISWQTVSNSEPSTETKVEICNIKNSHQVDEYKLLMPRSEQAIFAVTHSGQIHSIELWNVRNCEIEKKISFPAANSALFSADSKWLASTDGYHAYVWEVQTGNLHFMVTGKAFESPKSLIQFNADGSRFLVSSFGYDYLYPGQPYQTYTISIFDTRSGQHILELIPEGEFLKNIIGTPEEDVVIFQDITNQQVWNIKTGQKLSSLPLGPIEFASQAGHIWIAPQQKDDTQTNRKIILYNYHTGEQVRELGPVIANWIRNLYLDSNGTKLLAHLFMGSGKENGDAVVIFDVENRGIELISYKLPWRDYAMSAYGNYFATNGSDGYVHLWNYESASPALTLWGNHPNQKVSDQYKNAIDKDDVYAMPDNWNYIDTFFLNERILITKGSSLRFWDTKNGYLLGEMKPDYSIDSLYISPDNVLIAVVGSDGTIRLWGIPNEP